MDTSDRNSASAASPGDQIPPPQDKIVLGKIASPFGVRGWTKVISYTEPTEGLLDYGVWVVNQNGRQKRLTVDSGKSHGKFLVVKFKDIDDRDDVAKLTNATVEVSRAELPDTQDGSFYWADLIGLSVSTVQGVSLGKVEKMMETGANDVLVVRGERERLIPWIMDEVIVEVALESGQLTVDWDPDF